MKYHKITGILSLFLFLTCALQGQPGRDLEYKGEHPAVHFSDSTYYPFLDDGYIEYTMDSIAPEDRVYLTYDTIQGFLINGHRSSVYELPSVIRYALTNPARKAYLPQDPSRATVLLLLDYPLLGMENSSMPSYRTTIGPDFLISALNNVLYDIWNEDARYAEDKVFEHLTEAEKRAVVARNPHRVQFLNFSDAYFPAELREPLTFGGWTEEPALDPPEPRNVIEVVARSGNVLEFCGEEIRLEMLYDRLTERMLNTSGRADWPESPQFIIVSLRNERATNYAFYLEVYNTIRSVYQDRWEQAAQDQYGMPFEQLEATQKREIREQIPMVISEAEPTNFGDE